MHNASRPLGRRVRAGGVVCIIDDHASLRRSLRNLLSSVGYRVETFESADAFLESRDREHAGCLVLDLRMPGMSGLDLLNHLTSTGSRTPVIVLTAHGDDATRQRSLEAGAVTFLEKPFQSAALLDAVRRAVSTLAPGDDAAVGRNPGPGSNVHEDSHMHALDRPIHFAGGTLGRECHICAFFNGIEEERRVLRSFVKDGLDGGEKSFHIVDPHMRDDHVKWLAETGVDVERAMASGQLEVHPWEEAHLRGDRFEQDAMLHLVEGALRSNAAAGYPLTRILAHMEWALLDKPGVDDLVEYEARVNYVLPKYYAPVICTYDLSKFSASVVMDVLRTHPMAIIGGVLQENPFFVPPDQLLLELRERRSARKSVSIAS
jgi:CheY-like chemotaxis protein